MVDVVLYTFLQINPHLSKTECNTIKKEIYGCGKPFRVFQHKIKHMQFVLKNAIIYNKSFVSYPIQIV